MRCRGYSGAEPTSGGGDDDAVDSGWVSRRTAEWLGSDPIRLNTATISNERKKTRKRRKEEKRFASSAELEDIRQHSQRISFAHQLGQNDVILQ